MSIVNIDAENVLSAIVEAMLPRFSDRKLGLLLGVDMSYNDYGYDTTGAIQERDELAFREQVNFLIYRPCNYTQVYLHLKPKTNKYTSPLNKDCKTWVRLADHDSCWREAFGELKNVHYKAWELFKNRTISGKALRPIDLSSFIRIDHQPQYVRINSIDKVYPEAERWTKEERFTTLDIKEIGMDELVQIKYKAKSIAPWGWRDCCSGLCIKGSEDH